MLQQTNEDPLVVLISNANIVDAHSLKEAISEAARLRVGVDRALVMSGRVKESELAMVRHALELVLNGNITLNNAISVIRMARKENITFDQARHRLKKLHQSTKTTVSLTNELTSLMLEAGLIAQEDLGRAIQQATQNGMLTGRVLRLNNVLTSSLLNSCIDGCLMLQSQRQTKEQVVQGLRRAKEKHCTIEQALFELGTYKQPESYSLRLADLLAMAGVLFQDNYLECWELAIIKKKTFHQVVLEQGLISQANLDTAVELLGLVTSETLRPYEAARVLQRATRDGASIYQALAEQKAQRKEDPPIRLSDLLVDAGLISVEVQSKLQSGTGSIKTGKFLLGNQQINEATLFRALRCQSLCRYGYLSRSECIEVLKSTEKNQETLEKTFKRLNLWMPSSMQWSWA